MGRTRRDAFWKNDVDEPARAVDPGVTGRSPPIRRQTGKIDVRSVDPLVYCATVREYWSLGSRLGFGFSAGKALVEKSNGMGGIEGA
jgi:hypothetical protein